MKRNAYQRMADQIVPRAALIEQTTAQLRTAAKRKRPFQRTLLAAAAALVMLLAGTLAVAGYIRANLASPLTPFTESHAGFWDNVFWGNEEAACADKLAGHSVQSYDTEMSGHGYTFTLENNIYDPNTEMGVAYFTVTNPNGLDGFGEKKQKQYRHGAVFPPELRLRCDLGNGEKPEYDNWVVTQECIDMERSSSEVLRLSVCYMLSGKNYNWKKPFAAPVLWVHLLDCEQESADYDTGTYSHDPQAYVSGSIGIPLQSEMKARTLYGADGKPMLMVSPIGIVLYPNTTPDGSAPDYLLITYKNGDTYLVQDETKDDFHTDAAGNVYNLPTYYTVNYIYSCGFDPKPTHTLLGKENSGGITWKTLFDRVIDPDEVASITAGDHTYTF